MSVSVVSHFESSESTKLSQPNLWVPNIFIIYCSRRPVTALGRIYSDIIHISRVAVSGRFPSFIEMFPLLEPKDIFQPESAQRVFTLTPNISTNQVKYLSKLRRDRQIKFLQHLVFSGNDRIR